MIENECLFYGSLSCARVDIYTISYFDVYGFINTYIKKKTFSNVTSNLIKIQIKL